MSSGDEETPARAALATAVEIGRLAPGPLSDLRRMERGAAAPAFWKLAARHPETVGRRDRHEHWIAIVRILAILTPKGDPAERADLHDGSRPLGEVLCDGGDPSWPPREGLEPVPVYSERRLGQLMAARGAQRAVLLQRAARAISRSKAKDSGIDVVDIAFTLLAPNDGRRLAEPYYRRLDRAVRQSEEGTTE